MVSNKILFILCISFLISSAIDAQLYFGIKGSYSLPFARSQEIKYDDAQDFLTYKVKFIEQDVSPMLSVFSYYRNDKIYLQGELGYRRINTRFSSVNFLTPEDLTPNESIKKTSYLLIPLSAGLRFDRFKFGVGPVFGYIIGQNTIFEEIENFEERRRRMDMGFAFNFGITLYRLHIDLSYEYQFNSVGDYLYYRKDSKGFDNQAQFVNLGLGFLF